MALISQSDIEAKLGRSLTSEEVATFAIVNPALQAEVEKIIGSSVESVSAATRYYDGGVQHLSVDPCTEVTAVKLVDDDENVVDTYDTTDYTIEPRNSTLKYWIRHRSGAFMTGINNLAVTAKYSIYGDSGMLAIVKNALIDAISSEINDTDNLVREQIEGYSVEYATTETKDALSTIKKHFSGII